MSNMRNCRVDNMRRLFETRSSELSIAYGASGLRQSCTKKRGGKVPAQSLGYLSPSIIYQR